MDQSHCGASIGNTRVTDLVFADDPVILAKSLEVLVISQDTARGGKPHGTLGLQGQDLGTGVRRLAG